MTLPSGAAVAGSDPSVRADAEELIRTLLKTLRIRSLYEPNNPIYREFSGTLAERFQAFLSRHGQLRVEVHEHELVLDGQIVHRDERTRESLPFLLHKDGIREITFFEGLETRELYDFLDTIRIDPTRGSEEADILSRLWEKDFVHIRYLFVDLFLEEAVIELPGPSEAASRELGFTPLDEEVRVVDLRGEKQVEGRAVLEEGRQAEVVKITPDDFDPTLYFLERDEVRRLREDIDREKERNLLIDLLALLRELVLLDAASDDVEPLAALEELLTTFFASANVEPVVWILDALEELAVEGTLSPAKRARLAAVKSAALSSESFARVAGLLDELEPEEGTLAGYLERAARFDLAGLIERLGDLKRVAHREDVLAPLVAAAAAQGEALHRLFRHPHPLVVKNAIFLSGRAASRQSLEALEEPLRSRDAEVRIEAIHALKTYRNARAMELLMQAVGDPDKLVRYYALRNLISFNYRPALRVVEDAISHRDFPEKDLTEKKLFFEAYGRFGEAAAIPFLRGILGRRSFLRKGGTRDLKVCAATALGEVGGEEARALLREHLNDRQEDVREACAQALARLER